MALIVVNPGFLDILARVDLNAIVQNQGASTLA
jgi:hypothetical protein